MLYREYVPAAIAKDRALSGKTNHVEVHRYWETNQQELMAVGWARKALGAGLYCNARTS